MLPGRNNCSYKAKTLTDLVHPKSENITKVWQCEVRGWQEGGFGKVVEFPQGGSVTRGATQSSLWLFTRNQSDIPVYLHQSGLSLLWRHYL